MEQNNWVTLQDNYQNAGDGYIIIFYEYTGEKGKYIQQKLKQKYEQDEKFFNEK